MDRYDEDINRAVEVLRQGGVIAYPTDTIWGVGCDATRADAVERVLELKGRPDGKAMIVLVGSVAMLERTVDDVPDAAMQLIDVADKPLTIIYDRGRGVAPGVAASDGSLAVRVTNEEFSRRLCTKLGRPLVSTSANFSGNPSPTVFAEIDSALLERCDYVCTTGRDRMAPAVPSGIIKVSDGGVIKIIR